LLKRSLFNIIYIIKIDNAHLTLKNDPIVIYFSTDETVHLNLKLDDFKLEEIMSKCTKNILGFKDCTYLKMDSNEFSTYKSLSKGGSIINESNLTNISYVLTTKKLINNPIRI